MLLVLVVVVVVVVVLMTNMKNVSPGDENTTNTDYLKSKISDLVA